MSQTEVLVLGSGIAGLLLALETADHADVLVLSKRAADDTNTNRAQGGIAAVFDREDSFADHERDTRLGGRLGPRGRRPAREGGRGERDAEEERAQVRHVSPDCRANPRFP